MSAPPLRCDTCRQLGHEPGCPDGPRPEGPAPCCASCGVALPWGAGWWFAGRRWCFMCAEGAHWRREPPEWAGEG